MAELLYGPREIWKGDSPKPFLSPAGYQTAGKSLYFRDCLAIAVFVVAPRFMGKEIHEGRISLSATAAPKRTADIIQFLLPNGLPSVIILAAGSL